MKTMLATAINHMSPRECGFLKSRQHSDEQVRLLAVPCEYVQATW